MNPDLLESNGIARWVTTLRKHLARWQTAFGGLGSSLPSCQVK